MKQYAKRCAIALILLLQTQSMELKEAGNPFVKPKQVRGVSVATLKQELGTTLADILELSNTCSHYLVRAQRNCMDSLRSWLSDEDSFFSRASKSELSCKLDKYIAYKKKFQSICDEVKEMENELRPFAATC